ncbi:hypothetical protein FACS1894105_12320 [Clostridia bacterium]|nr:hypothetical protein FACS1894105_12320 [Clostridia bacterium]
MKKYNITHRGLRSRIIALILVVVFTVALIPANIVVAANRTADITLSNVKIVKIKKNENSVDVINGADVSHVQDGYAVTFDYTLDLDTTLLKNDTFIVTVDLGRATVPAEIQQNSSTYPISLNGSNVGTLSVNTGSASSNDSNIILTFTFDALQDGGLTGTVGNPVGGSAYWGFWYIPYGADGNTPVNWSVKIGSTAALTITGVKPQAPEVGTDNPPYSDEHDKDEHEKHASSYLPKIDDQNTLPQGKELLYWNIFVNTHEHALGATHLIGANEDESEAIIPAGVDTFTITDTSIGNRPTWLRQPTNEWNLFLGNTTSGYNSTIQINQANGIYGKSLDETTGPGYFKIHWIETADLWDNFVIKKKTQTEPPHNILWDLDPAYEPTRLSWDFIDELKNVSNLAPGFPRYNSEVDYGYLSTYYLPVPPEDIVSINFTPGDEGFSIEFKSGVADGKMLVVTYCAELTTDASGNYVGTWDGSKTTINPKNSYVISAGNMNSGSIEEQDGLEWGGATINGGIPSGNKGKFTIEKRDASNMSLMSGVEFTITSDYPTTWPSPDKYTTGTDGLITLDLPSLPMSDHLVLTITETKKDGYTFLPPFTVTIDKTSGKVTNVSNGMETTSDGFGVRVLNTPVYSFNFTKVKSGTSDTFLSGAVFTLYDNYACTTLNSTATSGIDGIVTFSNLVAGTYYFKETTAPDKYALSNKKYKVVLTDSSTYTIYDVTAANDVANPLAVNNIPNSLIPASWTPIVTKTANRAMAVDQFTFGLYAVTINSDGFPNIVNDDIEITTPALRQAKNPEQLTANASVPITFNPVSLPAAGTYNFVILEEPIDHTVNPSGWTEDSTVYFAKVVVEDVSGGLAVTNVEYYTQQNNDIEPDAWQLYSGSIGSSIEFVNEWYKTKFTPQAIKTTTGKAFTAEQFEFELYESDATGAVTEVDPIETVVNGVFIPYSAATDPTSLSNGYKYVTFTAIDLPYESDNPYYYLMKEKSFSGDGWIVDDSEYLIRVRLYYDGSFTTEIEYAEMPLTDATVWQKYPDIAEPFGYPTFVNDYFEGTRWTPVVTKTANSAMAVDQFTFGLYEAVLNSNSFPQITNGAVEFGSEIQLSKIPAQTAADTSVTMPFAAIPYTDTGIYGYLVREEPIAAAAIASGWSADDTVYFVKVEVKNNSGTLSADVKYYTPSADTAGTWDVYDFTANDSIKFVNSYTEPTTPTNPTDPVIPPVTTAAPTTPTTPTTTESSTTTTTPAATTTVPPGSTTMTPTVTATTLAVTTTISSAPTTSNVPVTTGEQATQPTIEEPTATVEQTTQSSITESVTISTEPATVSTVSATTPRVALSNGWTAEDLGDGLWEIFDENGVPLGYIHLSEGESIEEYDIENNLTPLGNLTPQIEKLYEIDTKENPETSDNLTFMLTLFAFIALSVSLIAFAGKKRKLK